MSLYFVTVSQLGRQNRSLGQRVPRYQKIIQVRHPPPPYVPPPPRPLRVLMLVHSDQVCAQEGVTDPFNT